MHNDTTRSRPAPSLTEAGKEEVERIAAALGVSLEIWNAPGHHGQRLFLGPACHRCHLEAPRTFDRCRKRRSYLNRPEAPIPEKLAEKCPQQVRLARLGAGSTQKGPALFAFGYEAHRDATEADAAILAWLHDLEGFLSHRRGRENQVDEEEIARFFAAAADATPQATSGSRKAQPPSFEAWAELFRHRLDAEAVYLGGRDDAPGFVSMVERGQKQRPADAAWSALVRGMEGAWTDAPGEVQTQILGPKHPMARHFGTPLECAACIVPGSGGDESVLLSLRSPEAQVPPHEHARLLLELAQLWSRHATAVHAAQGSLAVLSDTLLLLANEREVDEQRGRTQRIRCLALLLAQELKLLPTERLALHWACLLRGIGDVGDAGIRGTSRERTLEPPALALPWENLPLGRECLRILERSHASRPSTQEARASETPLDLAGDCLVVAEALEDLLSRGGSSRPRSVRAAVAFLEAGAGIAFDAAVVQALGRLEPALTRHPWVFLLGRHTL